MFIEIEPNAFIIGHTHPGIESSYVLEGGLDLQPTRSLKAGDGFQVPSETPHAGVKNGGQKTRLAIIYVVENGKPLVTPVTGWKPSDKRQRRDRLQVGPCALPTQ